MRRRPPRSTLDRSSAASDVYKRQGICYKISGRVADTGITYEHIHLAVIVISIYRFLIKINRDASVCSNGRIIAAVSYTHLRAHETVLDLVCRLLLEKQKEIINNTLHINSSTYVDQ